MSVGAEPDLRELFSSDAEDTAELIPDPEYGYDRVVPTPEIARQIVSNYCEAIRKAQEDRRAYEREMLRAEAVYEGKGDPLDMQSMITIPIAKRIINQQTSWLSDEILSKKPPITVKPLDDGSYQLPVRVADDPSDPGHPVIQLEDVPAAEAARDYEAFLDYKLNERLGFGQLVEDTLYATRAGENPTYWKIEYEPRSRTIKRKKYVKLSEGDNVVKILGFEDFEVPDGEATKIRHVFGPNCIMPIEQQDIQRSPWFAEKTPMSNLQMWKAIKDRKIDFALGDSIPEVSLISKVLGFSTNLEAGDIKETFGQIDHLVASDPDHEHDLRTLWHYFPIRRTQKIGGRSSSIVEIRSLCSLIHYEARELLACYINPYPRRPYIPFFQRKRPHRFSGTSSAQDLGPFQRLVSTILDCQIKNAVQQNVKVFLVRQESPTWRFLKQPENKLRPGMMIPYGDQGDVKPEQLGAPVASMSGDINYLTSEAEKVAVERDYTEIPNRLPAATFAQNEALLKKQPHAELRAFKRPISQAIELYLQTVAQYHQYESIPFLNPETNERVSKLIGFPREVFEQHFSFEVTATGEDDTIETRVQRGSMLLKETNVENESVMKLLGIIMDASTPAETKEAPIKMLARLEAIYGDLLAAVRPDAQKYILTEQFIRGVLAKVPPPPAPQQKEQDTPKITLTGQLPPEAIAVILQSIGINIPQGGQGAAQLPSGPAPVPPLPALPPGPGGPQPQPGNSGISVPGVGGAPGPAGPGS